jgi:DNA invertase Pin-like site-specific DNA recombinase
MNERITPRHLERKAILYVRQSTPQQLQHNEESRRLQYAMQARLRELGWREIEVVDGDLGRSAAGTSERLGFQRMVAEVSLGRVGAVAARELSRFARNSREWQQLIEICRMVDTLLVDQEAIYDSRKSNDRLLLGLKGTLNEYELDLLRLRAHEARNEKARRGEFFMTPPAGYVKTEDGHLEKTPDLRVQEVLQLVFKKFVEVGSVRQVVAWLHANEIKMPISRRKKGAAILWKRPRYHYILRTLQNPIFAGAYAWGRTKTITELRNGEMKRVVKRRGGDDQAVLIKNQHEGYINWAQFERNQEMIKRNSQLRGGPGSAARGMGVVAGLLRCRRCGRKLTVSYSGDGRVHRYACSRGLEDGGPRCISFSGIDVDMQVGLLVRDVVRPAGVEASLRAAREEDSARADALRALETELEAATYASDRAWRQFDAIDPENRLVADELERRWNEALKHIKDIERRIEQEQERRETQVVPRLEDFVSIAENFDEVWDDPRTDFALKKRIVRTVLEEIVVDVDEQRNAIVLLLHWKGGAHLEIAVPRKRRGESRPHASSSSDIVEIVRTLALVCEDQSIAAWLNKNEIRTTRGNRWTRERITAFRSDHRIQIFSTQRKEAEGWMTQDDAIQLVRAAAKTLRIAAKKGIIPVQRPLPIGPWIFRKADVLKWHERTKKGRSGRHKAAAPSSKQLSLEIPKT